MMLRYSFDLAAEADCIERAVDEVLEQGFRTADLIGDGEQKALGCREMTEKVLAAIDDVCA